MKGDNTYDLHVMWDLHHKCNFACSYCQDDLHNGSTDFLKLDYLKEFIDKIEKHYMQNLGHKNILFSFTGGEPTIWKGFTDFLEYGHAKGVQFGLTTNASVGLNFWKRTSRFFDYICMSFHPEFSNVDNFVKTFEFLHNDLETVIPSVRLMMHKENKYWNKSLEVMEKITKFPNWTYECVHILENYASATVHKTVYDDPGKEEFLAKHAFNSQFKESKYVHMPKVLFDYKVKYSDGQVEKLDENKLINKNQIDFNGWTCMVGVESLFVDACGEVWRTGCLPAKQCGKLGDVLNPKEIEFPTTPITCNYADGCVCPTDIRISKFNPQISKS